MASSYRPSSSSSSRFAPPDSGLSAHPKPFSGPQASSVTIPSISIPTSSSYPHPHPPIPSHTHPYSSRSYLFFVPPSVCLSVCLSV
ncbi:hypothetical protein BO83DRAFT_379289 [Aspergillus eucalypticola CBS 122712]|uniref:Uncharacterized protein n=1 Tax=Aspergillus eucalypticola (strain CBS 122712 / IBT 29274) TaxID=1448314 RepID=A0A317V828_ASPEC|nr:uncharacterized protein BO83DRAFT_379289 [Aspergillus eucalypticola CBS 122712]PWY70534.1 hypothetical protein BO83DRAFT_379289 [Aspergillus eucalypticola CBS 122712]